jgi:hypothetical protein
MIQPVPLDFKIGERVVLAISNERLGMVDAFTVTGLNCDRVRYSVKWDDLSDTWHYGFELAKPPEGQVGFVPPASEVS